MLDNIELKTLFAEWLSSSINLSKGSLVSLDGKNLCGSREPLKGKKALNIVSAWASEASVVLGQVRCEEKSNEITAIPELLNMLDARRLYCDDRRHWLSEGNSQTNH